MKKPIPLDRDAVIVRRVDEARRRRGLPKLRYSTPFISLGLHCALRDNRTERDTEVDALAARVAELEAERVVRSRR